MTVRDNVSNHSLSRTPARNGSSRRPVEHATVIPESYGIFNRFRSPFPFEMRLSAPIRTL